MIFTDRTIMVKNGTSSINDTIVLYRGDREVEIRFTLNEGTPFKFGSGASPNIIEKTEATYGQLVIKTPGALPPIFSEVTPTIGGKIIFTITAEMIDETTEVGNYTFQIRLLDDNMESRATLPEVKNGIEIREPIALEDITSTNEVEVAAVGYALTTAGTQEDIFDAQGNYNKTTWATGDRITAAKLNKIETGIEAAFGSGTSYDDTEVKNDINNIKTDLGTAELTTTAKNVKGAINELSSQIKDIAKYTPVQYSYCSGQKFEIEKHLNIFSNTKAGDSSIYWCWVIKVDDKINNPLGKYYMYYSTDHEGTSGFISLAYSDDLLSGWKKYGKIFKNGSYETETPSVMWDEVNNKFIMYFHSASSYTGEAQTSYYTTSTDGINFDSAVTKLLNLDLTRLSGDGHNGYFHPFKIGNKYIAYHLLGGGNIPRFAISYSDDGYNWETDHKQLGYFCLRNNRFMSPNHCTIINKFGINWLIGINTNFTSGSTAKSAYVGIVPMQDLYTPIGYDTKLFNLDGTGESSNIRQVSVYSEENKLYVFYQCDNNLHCAIIK